MYGRYAYAQTAYASSDTSNAVPPNQVIPPSIPGGTTRYYWSDEGAVYPYGYRGYAGARPRLPYLPGGIIVTPDPAAGVMRLTVWWPNADGLVLLRQNADGTREPVRGAYGVTTQATRTNWSLNPGFETGLNGVVPADGNPTLTQLADPAAPAGQSVLRATIAGAGSCGVTLPTSLTGQLPVTLGVDVRLSATPTALRLVIQWTDAVGGALSTTTATQSSDSVAASVGQWGRQIATLTPPAGAVTPTVKVIADGLSAAATMDLDGVTIEQAGGAGSTTIGTRFDGDSLGGSWTGTPGLSTSLAAPVLTVVDGECPLDVQVTYIAANLDLGGGSVTSPPVVLESGDRAWLTHPATPDVPFQVNLRVKPVLTYKIPQGTFRPIDRRNAIVVTAARQSAEGTLDFNALSRDRRYELAAVMEDGQPVLLRAPADYDWDPRWVSLGDATHDPEDRLGWQDAWKVSAPFVEVDAPTILA